MGFYWNTSCASTEIRCNGNNDGLIELQGGAWPIEGRNAWRHMELAEIISDETVGYYGNSTVLPGTNTPEFPINSGHMATGDRPVNKAFYMPIHIGGSNYMAVSGARDFRAYYWGGVTPADSKWIDKKIDDGAAATGNFTAENGIAIPVACISAGEYSNLTAPTCRIKLRY